MDELFRTIFAIILFVTIMFPIPLLIFIIIMLWIWTVRRFTQRG